MSSPLLFTNSNHFHCPSPPVMGTKLLPQAFVALPSTHSSHGFPRNLCFSTRRFSSIISLSSSTSCVFDNRLGFHSSSRRQPFVVRAESGAEEGGSETSEGTEETAESAEVEAINEPPEAEAEAEIEGEPKPTRKARAKLGEIMGILNQRAIDATRSVRPTPDIRTGDIVEIKLEVPENRRRLSVYKGIVISRQNAGIHTTIRIRRIIAGIGVEIVFPLYSPNIKEIRVVSHRKVRKARLYYLRDKLPRLSTFK